MLYYVDISVSHQLSKSRYDQLSALVIQMMAILCMPFVVIAVNTSAGRLLVPEGIIPNSPPAEVSTQ
jgi:hypothetical protein